MDISQILFKRVNPVKGQPPLSQPITSIHISLHKILNHRIIITKCYKNSVVIHYNSECMTSYISPKKKKASKFKKKFFSFFLFNRIILTFQ